MRRMFSLKQIKEIADSEVQNVVSSGELENVKIFENIVDQDGHKRFVEGNITLSASVPEGLVLKYGKWTLNLMMIGVALTHSLTIMALCGVLTSINPEINSFRVQMI